METSHQPTSRGVPRPIRGLLVTQAPAHKQSDTLPRLLPQMASRLALAHSRIKSRSNSARMTGHTIPMDFIYQDYALEPLGQLCIDLANSVNELARSGRAITDDERANINEKLKATEPGTARYEVAKLPDDQSTLVAQSAGGALHAIGQILTTGVTAPLAPAILARTAVENSAVLSFLCEPADHLARVTRAVNLLDKTLREDGAMKAEHPFSPIRNEFLPVQSILGQMGYMKSNAAPSGYQNLADNHLSPMDGGRLYSELNKYVHSNLLTQLAMATYADHRPWSNHWRTYDFVLATAGIVAYSTSMMEPHRSGNPQDFHAAAHQVTQRVMVFNSDSRFQSQ